MPTQAEISAAESAMNSAKSVLTSATVSAQSYHNALSKCVSGKGNGKPLSSDNLPDFLEPGDADTCVDECWACSCQEGGCCEKSRCRTKVTEYNARVNTYDVADTNYENAKDHYEELSGLQVQGDVDLGVSKIEEEAKAIRTRYYVFGGIVIILLVAGIFIYMKLRK